MRELKFVTKGEGDENQGSASLTNPNPQLTQHRPLRSKLEPVVSTPAGRFASSLSWAVLPVAVDVREAATGSLSFQDKH
ncbi:hypothetical protein Cadr_000017629 [Camelus dromedarius]|uniref:Uncharacterized protein n=1 Tax=Camelus dromedarius TaxID=9838 RepID=A0A5N4DEK3_CAMDR|nr:hypothetical protein Cadr_000017629 [Camelus dromedarius]